MPRSHRQDEPGAWFHVMNRGLARRTTFPDRPSVRMFLSRLAWASRSGRIEVHSYCVLATHYHLLARSPRGELSEALGRAQNLYVRWFNRRARRDGPLFHGGLPRRAHRLSSIQASCRPLHRREPRCSEARCKGRRKSLLQRTQAPRQSPSPLAERGLDQKGTCAASRSRPRRA